jgi:dephospho-CoA kinase
MARAALTIIGLTGSIGMGKSTAAKIFESLDVPVHVADDAVHALLKKNGRAVPAIKKLFPDVVVKGAVDRKKLGAHVFHNAKALKKLEAILHPLIRKDRAAFIAAAKKKKAKAAVLDIPLLFEAGIDRECDITICVTAPYKVQKERVMARPDMTPEKFRAILKQQMPDKEKRRRADYVVQTGKGLAHTRSHLKKILSGLI